MFELSNPSFTKLAIRFAVLLGYLVLLPVIAFMVAIALLLAPIAILFGQITINGRKI